MVRYKEAPLQVTDPQQDLKDEEEQLKGDTYLPVQGVITTFLFRREALFLFLRVVINVRRPI